VQVQESDSLSGQIREAILRGELSAGMQLKEQMFVEKYGVSRTPVRQALTLLAGEGLVVQFPRLGFFVRKLTNQEAIEMVELRRMLEAFAASLAAKNIQPHEAAELEKLAKAIDEMAAEGATVRVCMAELRFHRKVVELAGNGELSRALWQLQVVFMTLAVSSMEMTNSDWGKSGKYSHIDAAKAIASGDRQKAHDIRWAQFDPAMTALLGASE
jgi:DNA-binding GntR family transcriptional regulator